MDTARWKGDAGNRGRPVAGEDRDLDADIGRRLRRVSDRVMVPQKPGNSGGGKDPDFWRAFEDGEVGVIGDEPCNT